MINKTALKEIGLTNNEIEIYLILLTHTEVIASKVSEKTRISRPHVYDSLKKLIEKGMATYIVKDGKKYFKPTNPTKIVDYLKEKEVEIQNKQKSIQELLPELKQLYKTAEDKSKIEVYEGSEGIKTILTDMIRTGKEMMAFNSLGEELVQYLPAHVIKKYVQEREKRKIRSRQFYMKGAKIIRHKMAAYKELPKEFIPVTLFVYGNNVVIFNLIDKILTIKIQSKEIAKLYKNQFELMWTMIK